MANGGTLVPGTGGAVVLIDYQGQGRRGGGLAALNVATGEVKDVVSRVGAGGGRFSSPNDVVIVPLPSRAQPAGANATSGRYAVALFSDPAYGFDQQFRTGEPDVGEYVWAVTLRLPPTPGPGPAAASAARRRWWPEAVGPARVVAGGFVRPNGLAISPDRRTAYISDTGYVSGGGTVSNGLIDTAMAGPPLRTWSSRPAAVYAFDLVFAGASPPSVVLDNRRMFAVADVGAPDGLHCDADGRLWSGEGDGVSAYEPDTGRLLLRVRPGAGGGARAEGVANFAIVGGGAGGGGLLVMGQEQAATAVRLPGLRAFNIDSWLD
jgi:gluconolactonase